ncbi:MAG: hypothetical protein OXE94_07250 [Aestuariivita sp.]|nr:hypothetical protein [Aestuariivita sp.]MCY4202067.1 hypothetical protein [Aestuariivita sp.]
MLRASDLGLSVNWLEILEDSDCADPVAAIRNLVRMSLASTGRFAKLNVGQTKEYVPAAAAEAGIPLDLTVVHAPLPAESGFEVDHSHAEILGLPDHADDASIVVGDLIAECVVPPLIPAKPTLGRSKP